MYIVMACKLKAGIVAFHYPAKVEILSTSVTMESLLMD